MSRLTTLVKSLLHDARIRKLLVWCLPALLLGLVFRVVLTAQLPWAYFHDDTGDYLTTPDRLLFDRTFELHSKKTFLAPIIFTVPFLLHIPAMLAIPLLQHCLGLALIVLVGALCRLWFAQWKWFIVPLTALTATNPALMWYEHTLLAEAIFVFCTVLLALAGTLYTLAQTRGRFVFLCVALFLEAGARPEGKLLFGFAFLLLALLHFRNWRLHRWRIAILFLLALVMHPLTRTSQGGLLLYTSLARLTPPDLRTAPGLEPYIAPIRDDLQQRWKARPSFPKVRARRAIATAVRAYLRDSPQAGLAKRHTGVNDFCLKLAVETCWRNFFYLPVYAAEKFRYTSNDPPSGRLDAEWVFVRQRAAIVNQPERTLRLARGLTGRTMSSTAELQQFVDGHYSEVGWFNSLQVCWVKVLNAFRFPDAKFKDPETPWTIVYSGVPFYFLVGAAGMVVIAFRRGTLRPFHIAWGLTLLGLFYTIMLTANVRPRFRVVFEPFWFLYIGLLVESLWLAMARLLHRQ